jgi:hypothetical protein
MPKMPKLTLDVPALCEDLRKVGIVLTAAGFAGIVIDSDQITALEGLALLGTGIVSWLTGLLLRSYA